MLTDKVQERKYLGRPKNKQTIFRCTWKRYGVRSGMA